MMKPKQVLASLAATVVLASATVVAQPYGKGLGMMGGYGMGPGMMGGGYGMGPGMMAGCTDAYAGLDLTPEQHQAIAGIHQQASKAMWQLMGTVHGQGHPMPGLFGLGPWDEAETRKSFQAMADAQKAMFELQLSTRKQVEAVLTKAQREKLNRQWGNR